MENSVAKAMRVTWESCRHADTAVVLRHHADGFTLIELVVVLALAALLVGLALPFGVRALNGAERRGAFADLGALLAGYPVRAYYSGTAIEVNVDAVRSALPELPPDCVVSLQQPLRYGSNGMAEGGEVRLVCAGEPPRKYRIARVTGDVLAASP